MHRRYMTSARFLYAATVLGAVAVLTAPVPASASAAGAPPAATAPAAPAAAGTTAARGAAEEEQSPAVLVAAESVEDTEDIAFPWTAVGAIVLVLAAIGFRAWQMFGPRSKKSDGASNGEAPAARKAEYPRDP